MNTRELLTKWGFKIEHEKLTKMETQLESIKQKIGFLAGVEAIRGLFELGEKFGRVGEEIHNAAIAAGLGVEEFQKLAFAAEQSGVSQEEMGRSLTLLARHLYQARQGSAQAQLAFANVGFTPDQVRGFKTAQDAFLALSDRMRAEQDPIKKAALGRELLGRSSQRMALLMSEGSKEIISKGLEAQRLGLILTPLQIKALEDLEHAMLKIFAVFKAVSAVIASQVAPVFKAMTDDFLEFFAANKKILDQNIENWLIKTAYAMGFVWGTVKNLSEALIDLAKKFHVENDVLVFVGTIAGIVAAIETIGVAVKGVEIAWGLFMTAFTPITLAIQLVEAFQVGVALLAETIAYAADAMWLLDAAAAIAEAPLWLVVGAITAIVVAVHDLYALLTGGNTWTGALISKAGSIFSGSGAFAGAGQSALASIASTGGAVAGGGSNLQINAPMTFNSIPPGTDPKEVGQIVKTAQIEHFETILREADRDSASGVLY